MASLALVVLVVLCLFVTIIEGGKEDKKTKKDKGDKAKKCKKTAIKTLEKCLKKGKRRNALIFTNEFVLMSNANFNFYLY